MQNLRREGSNTLAHSRPPTIHWSPAGWLRIVAAHKGSLPCTAGLARPGLRHVGRRSADDDARHGHPTESRPVPQAPASRELGIANSDFALAISVQQVGVSASPFAGVLADKYN